MINTQIVDYIKQQLAHGLTRETIQTNLLSSGWNLSDITEAFSAVQNNPTVSVPPSTKTSVRRSFKAPFFIAVLIVLVIATVAYYFVVFKNNQQVTDNNTQTQQIVTKPAILTDSEYLQLFIENTKLPLTSFFENLGTASSYGKSNDITNALIFFKKAQGNIMEAQTGFKSLQEKVPLDMVNANDLLQKAIDIDIKGINLYVEATNNYNIGKQTASTYGAQLYTASNYIAQGNSYIQEATTAMNSTSVQSGVSPNVSEKSKNSLLSKNAFTNNKYGVTMYPPDGWYAKQDDYFNAQIMFLDKAQSTISDFASSNAIISLSIYPNDDLSFSSDKYINEVKKELEGTIQLAKSAGMDESVDDVLLRTNREYSLFKDAISKKEIVVVDGISGIAYNFGAYFNGTGIGRTIILEKDKKVFVIIAEVKDENTWVQDKEKIIQSMMSFRLIK